MAGYAKWTLEIQRTFIHVPDAREEDFAARLGARAASCPPLRLPPEAAERKLVAHAFGSSSVTSAKSGRSCLSTRAPSVDREELHAVSNYSGELDVEEVAALMRQLPPREGTPESQLWEEQEQPVSWERPVAWELAPVAWPMGSEAWDWSWGDDRGASGDGAGAPEHSWTSPAYLSIPVVDPSSIPVVDLASPTPCAVAIPVIDLASPSPCAATAAPPLDGAVAGSHASSYSGASTSTPDDGFTGASRGSSRGPEITAHHRLHNETHSMGRVSPDCREFTKTKFEGRLSVVTESQIRTGGVHRYLVQFTGGNISSADGVGFVFSNKLPCPKNIQRITSVFVNRGGRICLRSGSNVVRATPAVRRWEVGDFIEVSVDLEELVATFRVWPRSGKAPSVAAFDFGAGFAELGAASATVERRTGYLAAVVQNLDVSIALRS